MEVKKTLKIISAVKKSDKTKKIFILFLFFYIISHSAFCFASVAIKDLSPSSTGYKAVSTLVKEGILDVDSSGNFRPSLLVTKLDLARYLYNLIERYDLESISKTKTQATTQTIIQPAPIDLSKYDSKIASVESKINAAQNEISELKKRMDSAEKRISGLASLGNVSDRIEQSISSLQKEILSLKSGMANLEKSLSGIQKELRDRITLVENKSKTLEEYYSGVIAESARNAAQRMEFEALKAKVENLENSFNNLLKDYTGKSYSLSSELSRLSGKITTLETTSEKVTKELENLSSKVKVLESNINNLSNILNVKIVNYESEILKLKEKTEELNERLGKIEKVINKTEEFVQKIEAVDVITVANTFSNIQLLTNRLDQVQARLSYLEKSHTDSVNALLENLSQTKNENSTNFEQLKIEIKEVKEDAKKTEDKFNSLNKEIENLKNELNLFRTITTISLATAIVLFVILLVQ